MLGLFARKDKDAVDILKNDHDRVKELFEKFEKTESRKGKKEVVDTCLRELKLHAAVEEEIFYPAVRRKLDKDMMNEADEEHHVAKVLIAELDRMDGTEDHYDAKFTVLAENVRHHIKEEENEMLPKAKGLDLDFERLGDQIQRRKAALLKNGFPVVGEEKMVSAIGGRGDSPAQASRKKQTTRKRASAVKKKVAKR